MSRDTNEDRPSQANPRPRKRSSLLPIIIIGLFLFFVVGAGIAVVIVAYVVTYKTGDAKKTKAQLGCQTVASAVDAYRTNPANPGTSDEELLPQDINQLVAVPFGGPSLLRNGAADTIDPWGKPYKFDLKGRADGTTYIFVHTTAPDGTLISQFGIGPNAQPRN